MARTLVISEKEQGKRRAIDSLKKLIDTNVAAFKKNPSAVNYLELEKSLIAYQYTVKG